MKLSIKRIALTAAIITPLATVGVVGATQLQNNDHNNDHGNCQDQGKNQDSNFKSDDHDCKPKPAVACTNLVATYGTPNTTTGNVDVTLTATGTAVSTTITSYSFNFGDSSVVTGASAIATHNYVPGTYTAVVTVKGGNSDKPLVATCQTTVTVAKPVPPAVAPPVVTTPAPVVVPVTSFTGK